MQFHISVETRTFLAKGFLFPAPVGYPIWSVTVETLII